MRTKQPNHTATSPSATPRIRESGGYANPVGQGGAKAAQADDAGDREGFAYPPLSPDAIRQQAKGYAVFTNAAADTRGSNFARLVAKKVLTVRTLACCVNSRSTSAW